ncbi:hypothetical protein D3C81_2130250 [compost metagenome]
MGRVPSTAKVPARIRPAEVMTEPLSITPSRMARDKGMVRLFCQMPEIMKML